MNVFFDVKSRPPMNVFFDVKMIPERGPQTVVLCTLCNAHYAMHSMLCTLCNAINDKQSMLSQVRLLTSKNTFIGGLLGGGGGGRRRRRRRASTGKQLLENTLFGGYFC